MADSTSSIEEDCVKMLIHRAKKHKKFYCTYDDKDVCAGCNVESELKQPQLTFSVNTEKFSTKQDALNCIRLIERIDLGFRPATKFYACLDEDIPPLCSLCKPRVR